MYKNSNCVVHENMKETHPKRDFQSEGLKPAQISNSVSQK